MPDGAALGSLEDLDDLRVDGWLATRELQKVGLALARYQRIHHLLDIGQRAVRGAGRRTIGEAHRTGEIAGLVHVDEAEAGMLLVIGAEPAIIGTALLRARLELQRPVPGLM